MRLCDHFRAFCRVAALILGFTSAAFAQAQDPPEWLEAVAFMRAGQVDQALPLLDRLVSKYPANRTFRLELGYALFLTERYGRARYHLDRARAGNLNPDEVVAANRLIAETDNRKLISTSFNFSIRPETNAGRQTDLDSVNLFGFDFVLADDARATETITLLVSSFIQARPRLTETTRLRFGIETWSRFSQESRFQDQLISFSLGPEFALANGGRFEFGGLVGRRWNAGAPFSENRGAYLGFGIPIRTQAYVSVNASRQTETFENGGVPLTRSRLGISLNYVALPNLLLRGSTSAIITDASIAAAAGTKLDLRLGANLSLANGLDLRADLFASRDRRDGPDRIFGLIREDDVIGIEFGISDRDIRIGPFAPELILGAEKGQSSIDFYSFDNAYVNVGVRAQF